MKVMVALWPSGEHRRMEWADYRDDPGVGVVLDPETGKYRDDVAFVKVELRTTLSGPPANTPERVLEMMADRVGGRVPDGKPGDQVELPLRYWLEQRMIREKILPEAAPVGDFIDYVIRRNPPEWPELPPGRPAKVPKAKALLLEALADGPRLGSELYAEAKRQGLSVDTLRRAKQELGIRHKPSGYQGPAVWYLPGKTA